MDRDKRIADFFRFALPAFGVGYGVAAFVAASGVCGLVAGRYSGYIVVPVLAVSVVGNWFFIRRAQRKNR